jgi:hypothetical protein
MQKKIKIKFVDFWTGFNHSNNFFIDILSIKYHVEIVDFSPDFIIFSNFGKEHLKYKCPRLFFSSENERPNMFKADLAITMDFNTNKRHFRMPLFVYYLHQYGQKRHELNHITKEHALEAWNKKSKFCCAVISNGNSKMRNDFLEFLQKKEQIDSGGRYKNNIGAPVESKLDFIKDYKFVISFENSSNKGYTTEKLLEPLIVGSIPLYWGNKKIAFDFNPNCFINVRNKRDFNRVYLLMKEIEKNTDLALNYLICEKISDNQFLYNTNLLEFIEKIMNKKPISKMLFYSLIARFIDLKCGLVSRFRYQIGLNFR